MSKSKTFMVSDGDVSGVLADDGTVTLFGRRHDPIPNSLEMSSEEFVSMCRVMESILSRIQSRGAYRRLEMALAALARGDKPKEGWEGEVRAKVEKTEAENQVVLETVADVKPQCQSVCPDNRTAVEIKCTRNAGHPGDHICGKWYWS